MQPKISPIQVSLQDLPLHCPNKNTPGWNYHPRVFLDIEHTHRAKCPYCGNEYQLASTTQMHA